jgi:hypothetical protein
VCIFASPIDELGPRNPECGARYLAEQGKNHWRSHRWRDGFKKSFQFCRRSELRDRIEFLESRGKCVRQAPHGSGLQLLVLRIEVEFVNPPRQMPRNLQISLDERPVDRQLCRASAESSSARQLSTCRRNGSKFRCIRSTPIDSASSSEKRFECFARTGLKSPAKAIFRARERAKEYEMDPANRMADPIAAS